MNLRNLLRASVTTHILNPKRFGMTERAFITTTVLLATLTLNGCGHEAPSTSAASSTEQLTTVHLRIHGFMKSNSGAT